MKAEDNLLMTMLKLKKLLKYAQRIFRIMKC